MMSGGYRARVDFDAVNGAALREARSVLKQLFPHGKIEGSEYLALNPRRDDRRLGSFRVNMTSGRWADFALDDIRGGDLVSLVAYVEDVSQVEAARRLGRKVGLSYGR